MSGGGYPVSIRSDTMIDAFGRVRTSTPYTLFDSFHQFQDNGKAATFTSGSASSAHDANSSSIVLTVGTSAGDKVYRESSRVFAYQPGKSLLILQTFCMSPAKPGLRQRQGYFNSKNGIFFELNGTDLRFVKRSYVTGSAVDTVVPQSEWNANKMPHLDISRAQIMFIDIEWLGVGTVRVGFVINGEFVVCHRFHHANQPSLSTSDTTKPYMSTACLPVRAELDNITGTTSPSSYRLICTSIMSEGGYELRGKKMSVGTQSVLSPKALSVAGTFYPVIAIRLKSTRLDAIVVPAKVNINTPSAGDYCYRIVVAADVTGGTWTSVDATSSVEYNVDASGSVTTGTIIHSGFFSSSTQSRPVIELDSNSFRYQLERNPFTGEAYTFVVAIASKDANRSVYGTVDWEEVN